MPAKSAIDFAGISCQIYVKHATQKNNNVTCLMVSFFTLIYMSLTLT